MNNQKTDYEPSEGRPTAIVIEGSLPKRYTYKDYKLLSGTPAQQPLLHEGICQSEIHVRATNV